MSSVGIFRALNYFYLMEAMVSDARPDTFRHSHRRWLSDFTSLKSLYDQALAQRIWDYLLLAAAGEARYGGRSCDLLIEGYPRSDMTRIESYEEVQRYDPRRLRDALVHLFDEGKWRSGYGGPRWGQAVKATYWFDKLPPAAFVDHVADIVHNNGTVFNKDETGIIHADTTTETLMSFLDWRRGLEDPYRYLDPQYKQYTPFLHKNGMPPLIAQLLQRGVVLGVLSSQWNIPPANQIGSKDYFHYIIEYRPLEWGSEVPGSIKDRGAACPVCNGYHHDEFQKPHECFSCGACFDLSVTNICPHCDVKQYEEEDVEYEEIA